MGPMGCPKTSLSNYYSTLLNIPEERRSHLQSGGSLKSRNSVCIYGETPFSVCRVNWAWKVSFNILVIPYHIIAWSLWFWCTDRLQDPATLQVGMTCMNNSQCVASIFNAPASPILSLQFLGEFAAEFVIHLINRKKQTMQYVRSSDNAYRINANTWYRNVDFQLLQCQQISLTTCSNPYPVNVENMVSS